MNSTPSFETLIAEAAATLSSPSQEPADSFALHAPLELMARVGLLAHVGTQTRAAAHDRIVDLSEKYRRIASVASPAAEVGFDSCAQGAEVLARALQRGDLVTVDQVTGWLAASAPPAELRLLLGHVVVDSLAAAGHAPIGLYLLDRVAGLPGSLLTGTLHEVARQPNWRVRWFRSPARTGANGRMSSNAAEAGALEDRLRALPHLGRPGSDFIYPLMTQAENSGAAAAAMTACLGSDPRMVACVLARAAAWSMLYDDPTQAPYGWSHCLTMAQAVMSLAGDAVPAATAIAVAGTFVVGFRVAHGLVPLGSLADDAADDHKTSGEVIMSDVVDFASQHEDAHLAKYTLACLHAAADDPLWRPMYEAAAHHLAEWWRNRAS